MTFAESLQSHRGGLVLLKTQLYWYGGRGWDGRPGRSCLVLDGVDGGDRTVDGPWIAGESATAGARCAAIAHLLVDGVFQWFWVAEEDVELL